MGCHHTKFEVNPCSNEAVISKLRIADRQTDRQTDRDFHFIDIEIRINIVN
jgi:hypothetical protein